MTMKDVCAYLNLSEGTIYIRIKEGRLHPAKIRNRLAFNPSEGHAEAERARRAQMERWGGLPPGGAKHTKSPPVVPPRVRKSPQATAPAKPPDYSGKQCAEAVKLFRTGKTQLDLIVEMEISWEIAAHFWEMFKNLQPGWLMPPKNLSKMRSLLSWEEDTPTGEGFERAFHQFVEKEVEREVTRATEALKPPPSEDPSSPEDSPEPKLPEDFAEEFPETPPEVTGPEKEEKAA